MTRNGIQWPEENGKVSTMAVGKKIWAAAARGCGGEKLAKGIEGEKNWRNGYTRHCVNLADAQTESDEIAFKSAEEGLEAAYGLFEFVRDGKSFKVKDIADAPLTEEFSTTEYTGTASPQSHLDVPLSGKTLSPEELITTTAGWSSYGSMEPSCHEAIKEVATLPPAELTNLLADKIFVLLGATSAAGPAIPLLKLGATVAAIARPGKKLENLIKTAKETTSGTLLVPTTASTETLGADVLSQVPEVVKWLVGLGEGKTLVIGSYIYLDGEAHVRASVASDIIGQGVVKARGDTVLAYLGSPSIAHAFSKEAHKDAEERYDATGMLWKCNPLRICKYVKNSRNIKHSTPVTDGLVVFQGPNYALAKTMQSWRAMLSRRDNVKVSINLAPPMYTESICHVPAAMAALNGFQAFDPLAAFSPDTMSPILCMMLLWDLYSPKSTANPSVALSSVTEVFVQNAFHGGSWRCAYSQESIGSSIFLLGKCWYTKPPVNPPMK